MDYAPDFPIRTPGLLYDVNSFVPDVSGNYQTAPVPLYKALTSITGGGVVGAINILEPSGETVGGWKFYGTKNKLYDNSFTDRTGATSFSMVTDGNWSFCGFGANVLAANGKDTIRSRDITSGTDFVAIAGAPTSKVILVHENAILGLGGKTTPQGWACSDTGDHTQWSSSPNNNADSGTLYGGIGGPITAGTTWGKLAIAFKANAMYGGIRVEEIDQAIHWETLDSRVGCTAQNAHVTTELGIIFVSQRDILLFDGSKPLSIADKIRRTFFAASARNLDRIFLSHDELERNIYVWYNTTVNSDLHPHSAFVYNYRSGKWGKVPTIDVNGLTFTHARCPVQGATVADAYGRFTADDLNTPLEGQTNHVIMESGSTSYLVDFAHRKVSGAAGPAITRATAGKPSFTTGYYGTPNMDQTLSRLLVIPETSGTNPESGTILTIKEDAQTYSKAASVNDKGMIDQVAIGRYFQATVTWPTTTAKQTIADVVPEFKAPIKGR